MSYIIKVSDSDIQIPCQEGDSILQAVTQAGYEIPYSCKTGICGSCKGQVLAGQVDQPTTFESVSHEERERGLTLFCQAKPTSDIEILPISIIKIDRAAPKVIEAKVYRVTRVTADVTILELRFSAGKRLKFKAGQYLDVIMEDGLRRSYSMANQPKKKWRTYICHVPEGSFMLYGGASQAGNAQIKLLSEVLFER
jgi:ferredoxin